MNEYKEKLLCEQCQKPIGEVWSFDSITVHKPYINHREWKDREICNICRLELERKENNY